MILNIANEIEEALKDKGLVGQRFGSGFCLLDNSRDVEYEYSSKEVKEYFSKIEDVIKEVSTNYKDYEVTLRFRNDSFSFYVRPTKKTIEREPLPDECTDGLEVEDSPVDES